MQVTPLMWRSMDVCEVPFFSVLFSSTGCFCIASSGFFVSSWSLMCDIEPGIVIETQQWIDAINHPEWGQDQYQIYTVDSEPAVVFARYDFSTLGQ